MQQGYADWLKVIALTIGLVGLASTAAASDIAATQETVLPSDEEVSGAAEVPGPIEARSVPRLSAVDAAAYQAMKAQAQSASAAPLAQALAAPSGPESRISVPISFLGLQQGNFIPPDTIVGKSSTRVLEAVNVSLRLFTTAGGVLATKTLNTFFGAAGSVVFDPKVYYDRNAVNRRFYVVGLQQSGNSDATGLSTIRLAVSRSSNPPDLEPGNWCRYAISGKRNAGTANSSWADYPGLGVGADKVAITANQFRFTNDTFTFAIVRAFNKNIVSNNAAGCPGFVLFTFQPSAVAGAGPFTLQPAQHYSSPSSFAGTSNPLYLINSVFGSSATYQVWRLRNLITFQGPTNINGNFVNNLQANAPQDGSAVLLDTGDTRVTQVGGVGNSIAGVHGTRCSITSAANVVSCVRYVRVTVGQNAAGGLTAVFSDQSTFGFAPNGTFIFWPGVALNSGGRAGIAYHRNRNTVGARFLSSLTTQRFAGTNTPTFSITSGTCGQPFDRTGDYIGAQLDPSDLLSFWHAGERATIIGGSCRWQTQIIKVQVP